MAHYKQQRKGQDLRPLRVRARQGDSACAFEGCHLPAETKGLCRGHYDQKWRGAVLSPLRDAPKHHYINLTLEERECRLCNVIKPFQEFSKESKAPGGVKSACKVCDRAYQRDLHRLYRFGISGPDLLQLMQRQNGLCAICADELGDNFAVDHDHSCCPSRYKTCGRCVRGLLCSLCNGGIGMLKDNPEVLRSAATYLEVWASRAEQGNVQDF